MKAINKKWIIMQVKGGIFLPFYLFTFSGVLLDDKKHPRR